MTGRARRIAGWPATANRLRFDGLVLDKRRFDNVIRAAGRPAGRRIASSRCQATRRAAAETTTSRESDGTGRRSSCQLKVRSGPPPSATVAEHASEAGAWPLE